MKKRKALFSLLLFVIMLFSITCISQAAWKTENGARYYYSNGVKVTGGPKKIGGKLYLFNSKGELYQNKIVKYQSKLYACKSDGTLITTFATYNNKTYFGTSTGALKTGFRKYNDKPYYFNPKKGYMVKSSWVYVGKNIYYMQKDGTAAKNKWGKINGEWYRFDAAGRVLRNLQKIGKYYYLFDKTTGKVLHGSQKYGSYYYYLDLNNGRAITNAWKTISGKKYYYDYSGRRQTGWLILNGKKYYLDPNNNGAVTTGSKTIGGKTYNFGTKGYVTYHSSGNISIQVNTTKCVVTIYDDGVPVKAMLCSPGRAGHETPSGTFYIRDHLAWWVLDGPSLGQYCSHFLSEYLFHSVPMHTTSHNPYLVDADNFNKLGSPASAGCIRLSVADAKWIYYNVPIGSRVTISTSAPTPLGKPTPIRMKKHTTGADPTDDFRNPEGYSVAIKK